MSLLFLKGNYMKKFFYIAIVTVIFAAIGAAISFMTSKALGSIKKKIIRKIKAN